MKTPLWNYTIVRRDRIPPHNTTTVYDEMVGDLMVTRAIFEMLTGTAGDWTLAYAQRDLIAFDNGALRATLKRLG